ncbi:glutamate-rich protein 6B isoform X2 [Mesocricetus auratus]|uniref:Glutamate-rich protein 6B isoform X2 n=1 Tax=Mesocricetus auratus TaxID=10036 RepID=A0A3Q0CRK3_MESAU|nr:glutamate-rich protein 6B isoform X2 [Mesocricetus auratus]
MSENNVSPGPSGPGPPVSSKHSPLSSSASWNGEDSEEQEEESSLEESLSSEDYESEEFAHDELFQWDEESTEGNKSLEEEYLEEEDYLDEKTFLQHETYLFKEAFMEENTYLKERKLQTPLEEELKEVGTAAVQSSLNARNPVPSPIQVFNILTTTPPSSDHDLKFATSSYYSLVVPAALRDQSSQTEWPYFGRRPLISKTILDQDSSAALTLKKSELEAPESFPQGSFWDTIMNGPFDKQEEEPFDSLPSSYQTVFREIITELAAHHELQEDMEMPLNKLMESENRKKLGLLLKKNFNKYRETILWIMKRHHNEEMPETTTTVTYLLSTLIRPEKPDTEKILRHSSTLRKKLKLDTEWTQAKMKAHRGDGKLIAYHSGKNFHILFPNGTGQIYYPSGNLALLIACNGLTKATYIVLEDSTEKKVRGLVTNSGHATFYNEDGGIWLSLSKLLGYYFPKDKHQKAWNWWNLRFHVHAPPIMSITLKLNKYIHVQIRSQDKVIFCFFAPKQKKICLNMGTKFKFVNLKLLQAMKKKTVLETGPGPTSWKIQALLGKISRSLNFLTLPDLEHFTEVIQAALNSLSMRKSRIWV